MKMTAADERRASLPRAEGEAAEGAAGGGLINLKRRSNGRNEIGGQTEREGLFAESTKEILAFLPFLVPNVFGVEVDLVGSDADTTAVVLDAPGGDV